RDCYTRDLHSFPTRRSSDLDLEDYKGKYKDLYNRIKQPSDAKDKVSVLDDIDFQLELVHNDRVNQDYIMALLGLIAGASTQAQKDRKSTRLNSSHVKISYAV